MSLLDNLVAAVTGGERDKALTVCEAVLNDGLDAQ